MTFDLDAAIAAEKPKKKTPVKQCKAPQKKPRVEEPDKTWPQESATWDLRRRSVPGARMRLGSGNDRPQVQDYPTILAWRQAMEKVDPVLFMERGDKVRGHDSWGTGRLLSDPRKVEGGYAEVLVRWQRGDREGSWHFTDELKP